MNIKNAISSFRKTGLQGFDKAQFKGTPDASPEGVDAYQSLSDFIDVKLPSQDTNDGKTDLDSTPNKISRPKEKYKDHALEFEGSSKKGSVSREASLSEGKTLFGAYRFADGAVEGLSITSRDGKTASSIEVTRFSQEGAYQYRQLGSEDIGWLTNDG